MRCSLALAAFLVASPAWADVLCVNGGVPPSPLPWNQTVNIPRFDPQIGTLHGITISITSTMTGSCAIENLQGFAMQTNLVPTVAVTFRRPDNTVFASVTPTQTFTDNLAAFDGAIDFAGTSGVTHTGINLTATNFAPPSAGDLALFTGAPGNPGTVALSASGANVSTATAPGNPVTQFLLSASTLVGVCYDYTPTMTLFCPGDGSGSACPCGNASLVSAVEGCLNSTGSGAQLVGNGLASVSNDSVVLSCYGLPASSSVLFFQGTAQQSGGAGSVFGDGLRCVAGTVVRLHSVVASSGMAVWPQGAGATISGTGSVPANSTRYYQAWYRNAAAFCTPSTFNLSQGLRVNWQM